MSQRHHWWSRFSPKCGSYIRNTIIVFESFRGHNRSVKCPSRIWFLHSRMGQDEKITTYLTLTLPPFRQPIQSPQSVGSAGPLLLWKKSQKWYSFSFSLKMMIWSYNLPLYFSCNGTFFAEVCGNFQANSPTPWVESILWDVQNYNNERNGAEWISAEPNCMHKLAV